MSTLFSPDKREAAPLGSERTKKHESMHYPRDTSA